MMVFEPVGRPEPSGDVLRELEELSLGKMVLKTSEPSGSSKSDMNGVVANIPDSQPGKAFNALLTAT